MRGSGRKNGASVRAGVVFPKSSAQLNASTWGPGGDGHLEVTVEEQPQVAGKEGLAGTMALFA